MKNGTLPSVTYLRERVDYDPVTGVFTWRARPVDQFPGARHCGTWNTRYAGKLAGTIKVNGYRAIGIDDKQYYAHRIAWLMVYGSEAPHEIDHIDGDRTNNRIANLRSATTAQNAANKRKTATNTGAKGIWFDAAAGKFRACITHDYKQRHLGCFDTLEEATAARREAAERLHGAFARHE